MVDFLLHSISAKHPGFVRVLYSMHHVSHELVKESAVVEALSCCPLV